MNNFEREKFWQTLCSLKGINIESDIKQLNKVINYPRYIYRYRTVNTQNLEALRTNKLYFSSANYYDDPFDTFLNIDVEKIKKKFLDFSHTRERTKDIIEKIKPFLLDLFQDKNGIDISFENFQRLVSNGTLDSFLYHMLLIRGELKKDIYSVCFSEDGLNESLWLKYANQYRGFVQIYDITNSNDFLCGKQNECSNCYFANTEISLYPIYYSDIPYDATEFSKVIIAHKLLKGMDKLITKKLIETLGNDTWERERITLIKKKCHEYDAEWRIICNHLVNQPMMKWRPCGVILGLKMTEVEKNLVKSITKEADIDNIYQLYINNNNQLDKRLVTGI